MSLTLRIVLALAGVWGLAGAGIFFLKQATPTADNVSRLMQEESLDHFSGAERMKAIERMAKRIDGLDYEERQKLRRTAEPDRYYASMTDAERLFFLDQTLPAGFRQMMDAFNKMEPAQRKKMVQRALDEMEQENERRPPDMDNAMMQRIVDQGLRSFYNDATAETKLDLSPLIERMQARMQRLE